MVVAGFVGSPSLNNSIVAVNFVLSSGVTHVFVPPILVVACSIVFLKLFPSCSVVYPSTFTSLTVYTYSWPSSKSYFSKLSKLYAPSPVTVVVIAGFVGSPSLNNSIVAVNFVLSSGVIHVFCPPTCVYSLITVSSVGFVGISSTFASAFLIIFVSVPVNGFTRTWNVKVASPPLSLDGTVTSIPSFNCCSV